MKFDHAQKLLQYKHVRVYSLQSNVRRYTPKRSNGDLSARVWARMAKGGGDVAIRLNGLDSWSFSFEQGRRVEQNVLVIYHKNYRDIRGYPYSLHGLDA